MKKPSVSAPALNRILDFALMALGLGVFITLQHWGFKEIERNSSAFQHEWLMPHESKWLNLLFCLLVALLIYQAPRIKDLLNDAFTGWSFKTPLSWLTLISVVGSLALVLFVAKREHRIFYDEDIYIQIADNMARTGDVAMANDVRFQHGNYQVSAKEFNKEPNGHTYILSRWLGFFTDAEQAAFTLNNVTFILVGVLIFLMGSMLAGKTTGFLAGLIWLAIPQNIIWANTAAVEMTTAFFATLAVLLSMLFYTRPSKLLSMTAMIAGIFASTFRPEAALIMIPVMVFITLGCVRLLFTDAVGSFRVNLLLNLFWIYFFTACVLYTRIIHFDSRDFIIGFYISLLALFFIALLALLFTSKNIPWSRFKNPFSTVYWQLLAAAFLYLPHFFHMKSVEHIDWGATQGGKFSMNYMQRNLYTNLIYYVDLNGNEGIPFLITALAALALFLCYFRKSRLDKDSTWGLFLWFAVIWAIFIPFYAGSYKYGMDMRFAILTHMPLALLAALGLKAVFEMIKLKGAMLVTGFALVVVSFSPSWRSIKLGDAQAWASVFDHDVMVEISEKIPPMSYVFSHNPSAFSPRLVSSGQLHVLRSRGPQTLKHLSRMFEGGVYAYYGYWCQTYSPRERKLCKDIETLHPGEIFLERTLRDKTYKLVKISKEPEPDAKTDSND